MCGIYGYLSLDGTPVPDVSLLNRMGDSMIHRGPDDSGAYTDKKCLLGMRRLSIIDLAGGQQPLANEDSTIWTVCNGEIYNFMPLREQLRSMGHVFRTGSDCEVIVHLYEEYGEEFIQHIDGMFACAIWDLKQKRLLIARDRIGIKPLYYTNDESRLAFASEAKSLLSVEGIKPQIDTQGLDEYLTLGYCPAPFSLLKGIKKLPPASLMICEHDQIRISRYWKLPSEVDTERSEDEWANAVLSQIETSVSSQMVSDVPLGAFLSGGIDSSAVVAMMSRHSNRPVKTYSIGFEESSGGGYYNELPYARRVSELFKTDHKEIIVKPDVVSLLPELIWHMDEPIADAAFITTYLVSKFARQDVTVILSGVGGDELFGGYRRYLGEYYGGFYNLVPGWIRKKVFAPIAQLLPSDRHSRLLDFSRYARRFILANELPFEERYADYLRIFSREQIELMRPSAGPSNCLQNALKENAGPDELSRMINTDFATQMPDDLLALTDRMSMATSLECRVPLLDTPLVELAAQMPSRFKIKGRSLKHILKLAMAGDLPKDILYRPKRGFGAPMGAWLKHELASFLNEVLSRENIEKRGLFEWHAIQKIIDQHTAGREDHTDHLISLINLELWSRMYLDGQTHEEVSEQLGNNLAA